jgi:outer membrane receptor protein involved in Fe transport
MRSICSSCVPVGLVWILCAPGLLFAAKPDAAGFFGGAEPGDANFLETGVQTQDDQAGAASSQTSFDPQFKPASTTLQDQPIAPAAPPAAPPPVPTPTAAVQFVESVFGSPDVRSSLVSEYRRYLLEGMDTELVLGSESVFRATTDGGNLLGKSLFSPGVRVQQRTPVVTDPRVRGSRTGRLLASGSYWIPAREDLDTMLSKVDSRIIQDVIVLKGPYSVRYGPGFNFIDFQLLDSPRYRCGFQTDGASSVEYKTNGEQWYGRQTFWGGSSDWGFRVGYGHRTGNDYRTGAGFKLPTSYNSRDWDVALGFDLSPDSNLEFHYLRLDQTDVEFPGLVFDINFLVTNAYELTYTLKDQRCFDLLTVTGWYNRTFFEGDTSRAGKNRQIPSLRPELGLGPDQFALTDVDAASSGYRVAFTWGELDGLNWTLGTDLIYVTHQLNDILPEREEPSGLPPFLPQTVLAPQQNFPIPRSRSTDVGLFVDHRRPLNQCWTLNLGARVDLVTADARERVPGMGTVEFPLPPFTDPIELELIERDLSELKQAGLEQSFTPWSVYATLERRINCCWTLWGGAGHAVRPPSLTELYAERPFIGSLQPGLTFVEGDPELDPERLTQLDLGLRGDLGDLRMSLTGFYAWVHDYIIYDYVGFDVDDFVPGEDLQQVTYGNTDLATLVGFELIAEQDFNSWLTGFAVMSYVEGRDRTRGEPSRLGAIRREEALLPGAPRSRADGVEDEPLPGIPPLESRVGVRIHEAARHPRWGIEFEARIVAAQNRVARTLFEQVTPNFAVGNIRSYWQARRNLLLIAGVENFTDTFYREHLDYRPGRGVFQPGVNFYFSGELTY